MKLFFKTLSLYFIILIISSCGKKLIYFQQKDDDKNKTKSITVSKPENVRDHIIEPGDIVGLKIITTNKELNDEFLKYTSTATSKEMPVNGLTVSENGTIFLPYIGSLKIAGISISEAETLVKNELGKSLNNFTVEFTLNSFRVSVLGDVRSPGIINSPGDKMTIIDALSLSGDLGPDANRKNIKVIRQNGDKKNVYFLDISSIEIFKSEVYYLKSNDIVYIESLNRKFVKDNLTYIALFATVINTLAILIRLY
ncbi:MAG: polysaccharide export protein [Bacteroidetes bacterium]|nr:polysaccharide export protein [Bacteroidota bacterium]